MEQHVLPDLLAQDLRVVFCGTAAGRRSAQTGLYYAKPGNQFWKVLFSIGLTPRVLNPNEYTALLEYGVGLTDLAKTQSGMDSQLDSSGFDIEGLKSKIRRYRPKALAFNGKKAAEEFLGRKPDYGRQEERIICTAVFVLPSTSGAARKWWDQRYWDELAEFVNQT